MSSLPSAFDFLMSSARSATKKPPSSPSLPSDKRKRKGSNDISPNLAKSPNLDLGSGFLKRDTSSVVSEGKLSRAEKIAELKSKIGLLNIDSRKFDPQMVATWEKDEKIPFLFLCLAFDLISNKKGRQSRDEIENIACNMFRTVIDRRPDDLLPCLYLAAGKLGPVHEGLELGIGDTSIIIALCEVSGTTKTKVEKMNQELGDLGLVAKECRSSQLLICKPDPLTITKVFDTFHEIAKAAGKDSQKTKKDCIKRLLVAATDCEPTFLVRLLRKNLRIGCGEQTLLSALGQAFVYHKGHPKPPPQVQSPLKEAEEIVKQVYSVLPVFDKIVPALLGAGVWNLEKTCQFTLGVPVKPMLAKKINGLAEITEAFQNKAFTCEYKYDGERAQIHYMEDGSVEIYTRNNERSTGKFPDVILIVSRSKKLSVKSFVLDCELVAYDRNERNSCPLQILSKRSHKNVIVDDIKIDVCIYAFDMMYLNGQQFLEEDLRARREKLYDSFEEDPGYFQFATAMTSTNIDEVEKFLYAAVESSCEGLVIKTLDLNSTYEPSKRSHNWRKLKKDYMNGIGDSLDLVPIAAFYGEGKRTGVYGKFLMACYDPDKEGFQSICKLGTGFSEAELEELSSGLKSKVISRPKPYYKYAGDTNQAVWFEATEVWEVKAADLTISPKYCASVGFVDPNKGISLRFPRWLRVRTDKKPEDATTSDQIAEMYKAQTNPSVYNSSRDDAR